MRNLFLISLAFGVFCGCTHATKLKPNAVQKPVKETTQTSKPAKANPKDRLILNKTIETVFYDLNNDGKEDTIRLSQDTGTANKNWFNKITLLISGHKPQAFKANDGWQKADTSFLTRNRNLVRSENVYVYKDTTQAILLLFGHPYEDGREFSIIHVRGDVAKKVFDQDIDIITELSDLNNDGIIEVVGRSHSEVYEQTSKANICTYDPFYVYSISNDCKLNKLLTKKYNEEHYVWAGLSNTKVKVICPFDGSKPTLLR